ncbi:MAG: DEAD/DEAH box helicase [Clostridiales bacterium]|jgi:ATP-dependent RNA helicase DeaD|nr:DEAD/DEAH box helicase [Clostridiales bacterium]
MLEIMEFSEFNISDELLRAVADLGYSAATHIQVQGIPAVLSGRDVIGHSQTGTGKTAAFGIPAIEKIDAELKGKTQVLILCPTRELAQQVAASLRSYAKYKQGIGIVCIYGGQSIDVQINALKRGGEVVIGTPGRIMDHLRRRTLKLANLKLIILDEADEMLNMGFREDIETILKEVPNERQTLLFSATMSPEIMAITGKYQNDPIIVRVSQKAMVLPNIKQFLYDIPRGTKLEVLCRLIDYYNPKRSMIFCNTKKMVEELSDALRNRGYFAEMLHGDMKQFARNAVMENFKKGRVDMLIATDVAARGLDIDHVEYVINYDLPKDREFYVHRIGRTGRAGREGVSLTLITGNKEFAEVKALERFTKQKLQLAPIPTLYEVEAARGERIAKEIEQTIDKGVLEKHKTIVATLVDKGFEAEYIAAALLKMLYVADKEYFADAIDSIKKEEGRIWRSRSKGQRSDVRGQKGSGRHYVRIMLNVGKNQRVMPGNIVGAIAGETGLPGRTIRGIEIYENYSFVEVPKDMADIIITALNGIKMKGRRVKAEKVRMDIKK